MAMASDRMRKSRPARDPGEAVTARPEVSVDSGPRAADSAFRGAIAAGLPQVVVTAPGERERLAWPAAALLPPRLMVAWLDSHLRLVEMLQALVNQQVSATEREMRRALDLCSELLATEDPAERARIQLDHARASLQNGLEAARQRYDLLARCQLDVLSQLGQRSFEALAAVQPETKPTAARLDT